MKIDQAVVDDAAEILALQKLAYQSEAALYDDPQIPPLRQTLPEIQADFARQSFLKAVEDGRIIGSVRAYQEAGTVYIGRLIVHPDCQNQGIGRQLLAAIEVLFGEAERCELFTGDRSERNLYFYQKYGYREFRREPLGEDVVLVYMEKLTHYAG